MRDGTCDEGAIERAFEHTGDEIGGRRRAQAQPHGGKAAVEIGQQRRQPHRRRRLHRADRKRSLGLAIVARREHGLVRQCRHSLRVGQKAFAGAGQRHAAAVALEQRCADLGLQGLDALGDVGLHRVELFGGAGDAAGAGHRGKGLDVTQFHGVVSLL